MESFDRKAWTRALEERPEVSRRDFIRVATMAAAAVGLSSAAATKTASKPLMQSQEHRAFLVMSELGKAIELYKLSNRGQVPDALDELTQDDESTGESYIDKIPNDPWGNEFDYRPDNRKFTIVSAGPDEQMDTDDDVVYPKTE